MALKTVDWNCDEPLITTTSRTQFMLLFVLVDHFQGFVAVMIHRNSFMLLGDEVYSDSDDDQHDNSHKDQNNAILNNSENETDAGIMRHASLVARKKVPVCLYLLDIPVRMRELFPKPSLTSRSWKGKRM